MRVINGICSMGWEVNCLESLVSTVILVKLWMLWEAVKTKNQQWLPKTKCSQKEQKWLQAWASIWTTLNNNGAKGHYIWQRFLYETWPWWRSSFTKLYTACVLVSVSICTQYLYVFWGGTRFTVSVTPVVLFHFTVRGWKNHSSE